MQHINKPFAPFGAIFSQYKHLPIKPKFTVYLFCGVDAVKEARKMLERGSLALCVPPKRDFNEYRWELAGMHVLIFNTGSMSELGLVKIAHGVLSHGAKIAGVYSEDTVLRLHTLKKELSHERHANSR